SGATLSAPSAAPPGVGVPVAKALPAPLPSGAARDRKPPAQAYARGKPVSRLRAEGAAPNRRGTTIRFHPDPQIFGRNPAFDPKRLYRMVRSKAYLFRGVELRWSCDAALLPEDGSVPARDTLHFPGGLLDFLNAELAGRP